MKIEYWYCLVKITLREGVVLLNILDETTATVVCLFVCLLFSVLLFRRDEFIFRMLFYWIFLSFYKV